MHPMDKVSEADLAPFIADPRAAKASGLLPLSPPGGRRWSSER
jgi:hypothetical protein